MNFRKLFSGMITGLLLFSFAGSFPVQAADSQNMEISQNGIDFICGVEGFCAKCYYDYSQSSIGYGTKCTSSSVQPHKAGMHTITQEAAQTAMQTGIRNNYAPKVQNQTRNLEMNQNQFDALVSLAYNTGGGLNRIYNAPLTKYLRGEISESQARSQYAGYLVTAGGTWNKGLYNRRVKEANLFFAEASNPKPSQVTVTVNQSLFDAGETAVFTAGSQGGENYHIIISRDEEQILNAKITNIDDSFVFLFEEAGHYHITVLAENAYGITESELLEIDVLPAEYIAEELADAVDFMPIEESILKGDINFDGQITAEDLLHLQNYLQKRETLSKEQAEYADLNDDNLCNIFDLLALKQLLMNS